MQNQKKKKRETILCIAWIIQKWPEHGPLFLLEKLMGRTIYRPEPYYNFFYIEKLKMWMTCCRL